MKDEYNCNYLRPCCAKVHVRGSGHLHTEMGMLLGSRAAELSLRGVEAGGRGCSWEGGGGAGPLGGRRRFRGSGGGEEEGEEGVGAQTGNPPNLNNSNWIKMLK